MIMKKLFFFLFLIEGVFLLDMLQTILLFKIMIIILLVRTIDTTNNQECKRFMIQSPHRIWIVG